MKLYINKIKVCCVFLVVFIAFAGNSFALESRLTICIFKYAGTDSTIGNNNFAIFRKIYEEKISLLKDELSIFSDDLSYLSELRMFPPLASKALEDAFSMESDLKEYWKSSDALQLLRGSVFQKEATTYVRSQIYLGISSDSLNISSVVVRLPVIDEEFPNTSDTHSIVTYYALAMDAERLGKVSTVVRLLSKALEKLRDLERRGGIKQSLVPLKNSITVVVERYVETTKSLFQ